MHGYDQVQHYSCHCYTNVRSSPLDYELHLRNERIDLRATIGQLGERLLILDANSAPRAAYLPLVVLNACGSSMLDAMSAISFPRLFIKNGNRTLLVVRSQYQTASRPNFRWQCMAVCWGVQWISGQSVLFSRWKLLEELGNPLGLAFALYGDARLRCASDDLD